MGQTHADREVEIGRKFLDAGDPNSASYHFLAAVEIEPEKAEHHFLLGSSYCADEKFRDAEKPLREALRIEPNYAEALELLGKCAAASGHLASAEHYFQWARELESKTADAFEEGVSFYAQGLFAEAEKSFRVALSTDSDNADFQAWLGRSLRSQGRIVEAESFFEVSININPNNAIHQWLLRITKEDIAASKNASSTQDFLPLNLNQIELGISLCDQRRFDDAENFFRELSNSYPKDAVCHWWLGLVLRNQKRSAEAVRSFEKALRLNPNNAVHHWWLGRAFVDRGLSIRAESHFNEATRLKPKNSIVDWWSSRSLPDENLLVVQSQIISENEAASGCLYQFETGKSLYRQGRFVDAEVWFRDAVRINPNDAENHFWLGSSLHKQDRFVDAEVWFRDAVRINPNHAGNHFWLGSSLHKQERFVEAEVCFRDAVRINPNHAGNHFWLGGSLFEQERFVEAEVCFRDAVRINPNDAENQHWLGSSLHKQERFVEAEVCFRDAVRLDPNDARNQHWLGNSLHKQDRFVEAEVCFRDAVRINPNDAGNHFWLGNSLHKQERFVEAEVCFRDAVRLNPESEGNHYWLGSSLFEQERFVEAEVCFRDAVRINPNDAENQHWLGSSLFEQERFVEAEVCFREAVDLSPEIAEYHYWLGRTMQSQRSFVRANASFREAVRLDPQNAVYSHYLGVSQHPDSLALVNSESDIGMPKSFVEFLLQGQFWLENSHWNVAGKSSFLEGLYEASSFWADPVSVLFEDYEVGDEFLDETLARAELLAKSLDLQPVMPIFLETSELSIAMTIEGPFLRAWVGKDHIGVAVAVNLNTWKLHYPPGDRDGAFAVGAALNWFLDRSLAHQNHPHFRDDEGNTWKVSSGFYDDIKNIFTGKYSQPPIAHRVRGHIRTLTEREPTDESRDNAPSYIRRHMSPSDTWVRGYNKGDENSSKQLATRLEKFSSLADFLATAPRA